MAKQVRAYRRSARKQQVIKQLRIWHDNGYAKQASSSRLAKALDMRHSQHLLNILYEMVDEGDLEMVYVEKPGRWPGHEFLLAESRLITKKFSRRHISLKKRGVVVGQLEMFS
jgi:hypothetical protein